MSTQYDVRGIHIDPALTAAVIALLAIGAIMVGSASISLADREMGEPLFFLGRHAGALLIGCAGGLVALAIPMQVWFRLNGLMLLGAVALLASVLLPGIGHTVNGS